VSTLGSSISLPAFTFPTCSLDRQLQHITAAIRDIRDRPVQELLSVTYEDVMTNIMNTFDEAYTYLAAVPRTDLHDDILGFEAVHLLLPGRTINPKIIRAKGGIKSWCCLVERSDVVVCNGLGEAIASSDVQGQPCQHSREVISGQDVLVCPVYLLNELLDQNSCRRNSLANVPFIRGEPYAEKAGPSGYQWFVSENPFECVAFQHSRHHRTEGLFHACWKKRLQQVTPAGKMRWLKRILRLFESGQRILGGSGMVGGIPAFPDAGAICFGYITTIAKGESRSEKVSSLSLYVRLLSI
jgi:hypothetical protein